MQNKNITKDAHAKCTLRKVVGGYIFKDIFCVIYNLQVGLFSRTDFIRLLRCNWMYVDYIGEIHDKFSLQLIVNTIEVTIQDDFEIIPR